MNEPHSKFITLALFHFTLHDFTYNLDSTLFNSFFHHQSLQDAYPNKSIIAGKSRTLQSFLKRSKKSWKERENYLRGLLVEESLQTKNELLHLQIDQFQQLHNHPLKKLSQRALLPVCPCLLSMSLNPTIFLPKIFKQFPKGKFST